MKILHLIAFLSFFTLTACAQSDSRSNLHRQHAEAELKEALSEKETHNVIYGKSLILKIV